MRRAIFLFIFINLFIISFATKAQTTFQLGKDYELVSATQQATMASNTVPKKIQVLEFFNYGCPACYLLEPALEEWLKTKPADVEFKRFPVVFHSEWEIYAKAFYIAEALNIEKKLTPLIFKAAQDPEQTAKNNNLSDEKNMEAFFLAQGVKADAFSSIFHYSPSIDAQMKNAMNQMQAFGISGIPTVVINGKYKTNLQLAQGDKNKMIQIIRYLIDESRKGS